MLGESKETGKGSWRTEEGEQINQDLGGKLKSAGRMVDSLPRIIGHDERIAAKRFSTIRTRLVQARHSCTLEIDRKSVV